MAEEDSHRRISDLHHGGPIPSKDVVLSGMKGLERIIKDENEKKKNRRIEGDKILEVMRGPLRKLVLQDERTEEALKMQRERIERLRHIKVEKPSLPKFPSKITSGSDKLPPTSTATSRLVWGLLATAHTHPQA